MASENAKAVAREVSETLRKGGKVVLGKIIEKHYSKSTSKSPTVVTETKSYKEEMAPFIQAMIDEREAAIERMKKMRNKAKYRDLTDSIDKLTKNIQLLTGGKTDNSEIKITWQ